MIRALVVIAAMLAAAPAVAERLAVSLSHQRVPITSSFVGQDLVLFGAITEANAGRAYDVIVSVIGPPQTIKTRRKERVFGIWINTDGREFVDVPAYLGTFSNRPPRDIASGTTLQRLALGADNIPLAQRSGKTIADPGLGDLYRAAFVQIQTSRGLYRQDSGGVSFVTPTVFRADIPLPSEVATGAYVIDVQLFANGQPVVRERETLTVVKAGFEQYVANAARNHGLLYGIVAVLLALLTGWSASVVFRRD